MRLKDGKENNVQEKQISYWAKDSAEEKRGYKMSHLKSE